MNRLIASLVLLAGVSATVASADVLTETQTIGPSPTDIVQTQNFAQFNPALGTLTGVTVTASASQGPVTMRFTYNGTSPSPSPRFFRYAFDFSGSIAQGTNVIASGASEAPTNSDPFDPFANWGSISAPVGYTTGQAIQYSDPSWSLSFSNVVNVLPANFTPYVGAGTVPFDVRLENIFGLSLPASWSTQLSTFGQSSITVQYTYTPVPTPGAAALLGVGALAATRRRRSK